MKLQKIEEAKNMNVHNFNGWLDSQNQKGWVIVQIYKWQTYIDSDRLEFVILMEKESKDE